MSDEEMAESFGLWMGYFVVYLIWFFYFLSGRPDTIIELVGVLFLSAVLAFFPGMFIWLPLSIVIEYLFNRNRPETTSKCRDVLDDKTLDIHTPTLKQWDTVTPIYSIEEVGKYAECPYCGFNIRETFYEHGGIVRCNKCGAFHHKECFEYYGRKCGSSSCKLRNA